VNKYRIYGLKVLSEFKLNELEEITDADFDVSIIKSKVKFDLQQSKKLFEDAYFVKNINLFQLSVDKLADYSVINGNEILIDVKKNSNLNEFKIFLYGTCFAALLLQRKIVCLHGAGIIQNGKANLFLGNSGMGKSTLTSFFVNQGYQFLGDDVLPLKFVDNCQVQVGCSVPTIKLWEDNLLNLGVMAQAGTQIREDVPKFRYSYRSKLAEEYFSIGKIFILDWKNEVTDFTFTKLSIIESLFYLKEHIYRPQFIDEPDEKQLMLDLITNMVTHYEIIIINGNKSFESLNQIKALL
jgi:hypothetical protein